MKKATWSLLLALIAVGIAIGCTGVLKPPAAVQLSSQSPIVLSTSQYTDVGTNRAIYVAFTKSMDASTLNSSTFFVQEMTGTVDYDATNRIAYYRPAQAYAADKTYVATVTTVVKDASGTPLAGAYTFAFVTRSTPDISVPIPTPLPLTGCVPPGGGVSVSFDEPIDSTTLTASTFSVPGFTGSISYDALTRTATFTPSTPFAANTSYNLELTTGIKDLGGIPLDHDYSLPFTTCPGPTPGNFCTYTKGGYTGPGQPGQLLDANFSTVFSAGLTIGIFDGNGPQASSTWSGNLAGETALQSFLGSAALGASTALSSDVSNPTQTTSGELAEQAATLTLNIGFSGLGGGGPGFGNLVLVNTGTVLDGLTVSGVLAVINHALAGDGLPQGMSFSDLNALATNLNESFDSCVQSTWATTHLQAAVK